MLPFTGNSQIQRNNGGKRILALNELMELDLFFLNYLPKHSLHFMFFTPYPVVSWTIACDLEKFIASSFFQPDCSTTPTSVTSASSVSRSVGRGRDCCSFISLEVIMKSVVATLVPPLKVEELGGFNFLLKTFRFVVDFVLIESVSISYHQRFLAASLNYDMKTVFAHYHVDSSSYAHYLLVCKIFLLERKQIMYAFGLIRPMFHMAMAMSIIFLVNRNVWRIFEDHMAQTDRQSSQPFYMYLVNMNYMYLAALIVRQNTSYLVSFSTIIASYVCLANTMAKSRSYYFIYNLVYLLYQAMMLFDTFPAVNYCIMLGFWLWFQLHSKKSALAILGILSQCVSLLLSEWANYVKLISIFTNTNFDFLTLYLLTFAAPATAMFIFSLT